MYPVSAALLEGMTRSHARSTSIEIFRNGLRTVTNEQLTICGGELTIDTTAAVRRRSTFSLVVSDTSLIELLTPFGSEARITQYIECDNGASATIPLGWLRLSQPTGDDNDGYAMTIVTYDRSRALQRARLTTPYTIAAGLNYIDAIQALVNSRYPGLVWRVGTTAHVTPLIVLDVMADVLDRAQAMADSIGHEFFFDADGFAVIQPQPDPATAPAVVEYVEGQNCTAVQVKTQLSDEPGFNGAVVLGNPSTGGPVKGESWDDNPESKQFRKGPYLEVPTFLKSQFIASQPQADEAAIAERNRVLGVPESITFDAVPNPALDGGDPILFRRAQSGIDDVYVINTIKLPFKTTDLMTVTARRRKAAT